MKTYELKTVEDYLNSIPAERKEAIKTVRNTILKNLPEGYEEISAYGMIAYVVPLNRYPNTYNKQPLTLAALASQKNYMAVYLNCTYGDKKNEEWFKEEYKKSGKKLDMGKSCVRFKKLDDLPLDLVGKVIKKVPVEQYIKIYEASRIK